MLSILQSQQSHRMVIFLAIFILMTVLILYTSNNVSEEVYTPFHVATVKINKTTDLKRWSRKDGFVPISGNKVS